MTDTKTDYLDPTMLDIDLYKELFTNMINGFALHKIITDEKGKPIDYEFLDINSAFENMTGLKRKDVIGKKVTIVIPGIEKDPADWIGTYGLVALNNKKIELENYSTVLKRWYKVVAYSPKKDYFVTISEDITEKRNNSTEILNQKTFIEKIVNMSSDISYIYDIINKKNTYCNNTIQKILGYSVEELQEMGDKLISILMHPDDMEKYLKEIIPKYVKAKDDEIIFNEYRMKHKNGNWIWLECNEQIYKRLPNGAPQQIFGIIHDITERKKIEQKLLEDHQLLNTLTNNLPGFVAYVNADTLKYDYVNNAYSESFGLPRDKIIGSHIKDILGETAYNFALNYVEEVRKGKSTSYENMIEMKGEKRWVKVNYAPGFDNTGKIISIIVMAYDITEQKKAELALKESETRYKLLVDRMQEITVILDSTGKIVFANKFTLDTMGYTEKEFFGKSIFDFLTKDSIKQSAYNLAQEFLGKTMDSMEVGVITKKGEIRIVALSETSNPIYKDGKIIEMLINGLDITEQRKAEEFNKNIIKCTTDWIWEVDATGKYTYCSENAKEILGYEINEIIGKTPFDFMSETEAKRVGLIFEDIITNQKPIKDLDNWNIHKDGHKVCVLTNGFPIFDFEGKFKGYRGADKNITEQKKGEEELKESAQRLSLAVINAPFPIMIHAENQEVIMLSNTWTEITGYTIKDIPTTIEWTKKAYGKTMELVQKDIENLYNLETKKEEGEYIIKTKSGEERIWDFMSAPLGKLSDGRRIVMSMAMDITERKKVSEELMHQNSIFSTLLKNLPMGVFMVEAPSGKPILANDMALKLLGKGILPDASKHNISEFYKANKLGSTNPYPVEEMPIILGMNGKNSYVDDMEIEHPDGSKISLEIFGSPVKDDQGKIWASLVSFSDITQRKKTEEKMIKINQSLALAQESSRAGSWDWNIEKNIFYWSDEFLSVFGMSKNTIAGFEAWTKVIHPEDVEIASKRTEDAIKNHTILNSDYRIILPNKEIRWIHATGKVIYENNKPIRMIGLCMDITDKKRLEEISKEEQELSKAIISSVPGTFYMINKNGKYVRWNAYQRDEIVGKPEDKMSSISAIDTIHPDDKKMVQSKIENILVNGAIENIEGRVLLKGGPAFKWLVMTGQRTMINGDPFLVGVGIDMTERKKSEEEIIRSQKLLQRIIDLLPIRIFWKDTNLNYLGCNEIFAKDAGKKSPNELIGKDDFQMAWKQQAKLYRDDDLITINSGKSKLNFEERQTTPEGNTIWLKTSKMPLTDLERNTIGILGTYEDITEKKKAEEELRETRAILETAMNQSQAGIAIAEAPSGKLTFLNDSGLNIQGGNRKIAMTGVEINNYVSSWKLFNLDGKPMKSDEVPLARAILFGETSSKEFIIERTPTDRRIVLANAAPIKDEKGIVKAAIVIFLDITDNKNSEIAFQEVKSLNETIIENIPLMVFLKDAKDLKFEVFNRAGVELIGYERKDLIGKNDLDFFPPAQANQFMAKDREVLDKKGELVDIPEELINTAKNGQRLLHTRKVCIKGSDGNPKYLLGISEDITDRKKHEEELRKFVSESEKLNSFAINRELKMIELKKEINELNKKIGEKPKYTIYT